MVFTHRVYCSDTNTAVITVRGKIHERKSSKLFGTSAYITHHFERESQSLYEAAKRRFLAPAEGIPHFSMFLISYTLCQLLLSLCATLQSLTRPAFPAPKFFGFLQTRNILPVHSQISFSDIKGVPRVKKAILRILPIMPQISKRSSRSWGFQFLTT